MESIGIASWNLRNLSKKRPTFALEKIANIIKEFDLLAIQEVRDEIVIRNLIQILNKGPVKYSYVVSEPVNSTHTLAHQTGKRKESYAFIWNEKVRMIGTAQLLEADHVFVREPFCALFKSDKFDFVLTTIHVVWGKLKDRVAENDKIEEVLEKVFQRCSKYGERDVILCGDFNMPPEKIPVKEWAPVFTTAKGYETMVDSKHLYDQIWVNRKETPEFNGKCAVIPFDKDYTSKEEAVKEISDHRPVCAWFNTTFDTDHCVKVNLSDIDIN